MKDNIVKTKSFAFAIRIVRIYQFLVDTKKEIVLSKQLLRNGISVGAMVCEAEYAETKPDFIHKMAIAQKEINETLYWLELLAETNYLIKQQFENINADAEELLKLVAAILKSTKVNLKIKH